MSDQDFPAGKVLYQFTTKPEDNVTGNDDMPAEIAVIECRGYAGLVVWGRSARTGEWYPSHGDRHVIKRLLEENARLKSGAFTTEEARNLPQIAREN